MNAQFISPEMRANAIADGIGMGPIAQRRKCVYEAALEQIMAAVAIAANQSAHGFEPAEPED